MTILSLISALEFILFILLIILLIMIIRLSLKGMSALDVYINDKTSYKNKCNNDIKINEISKISESDKDNRF